MIIIEKKVIDMIKKIISYVQEGKMTLDEFPLDSVMTLIENTIGDTAWKYIGSKSNENFIEITKVYNEYFRDILDKNDITGCIHLLEIYELSYRCLYTAIETTERDFREGPYRQMIIDLGEAYAEVQYRLHKLRQGNICKKSDIDGRCVVCTILLIEDSKLYQPAEINPQFDYICFTLKEELCGTKEGVWEFRKLENKENLSDKLLVKRLMILLHEYLPEYDYSIWIDINMKITGDIIQFYKAYGEGKAFLGFPKSTSDCIYEDIDSFGMTSDDINVSIRKRMYHYEKEGYPVHNGLIDSRVMIRNHRDTEMMAIMEEWWEEVEKCVEGGDNCFNYVAWKNNYSFAICNLFIYYNPYFKNKSVDLDIESEEY